eukprot:TRINITY_DN2331_c0_g1_i1.p1 TRINITY_DN2331_c0_g1~~TRINITY_DN2331_c0_g1_i1.p1  ORF type:complete len:84 (-),score=1.17 TRINITY_DN2331_c0_g1_i1:30-281(-)
MGFLQSQLAVSNNNYMKNEDVRCTLLSLRRRYHDDATRSFSVNLPLNTHTNRPSHAAFLGLSDDEDHSLLTAHIGEEKDWIQF